MDLATEIGRGSALALAVVLAWAAAAKARDRRGTIASFEGLGLPAPASLAVGVPVVELVVAAALVAVPAVAAIAALVLLVGFSVVIGRAVAAGATVGCACFGGPASRPVSVLELLRNAGLAALGILATGAGRGPAPWPSVPALLVVGVLVGVGPRRARSRRPPTRRRL